MRKEEGQEEKHTRPALTLIRSQADKVELLPNREHLEDIAEALDQNILMADGFDEAIIGYADSWSGDCRCLKAVYDRAKCIQILMRDMDEMDAEEYFEFNVAGAYVGPNTPIYVEMFDTEGREP